MHIYLNRYIFTWEKLIEGVNPQSPLRPGDDDDV
jgi:hypothetical protein